MSPFSDDFPQETGQKDQINQSQFKAKVPFESFLQLEFQWFTDLSLADEIQQTAWSSYHNVSSLLQFTGLVSHRGSSVHKTTLHNGTVCKLQSLPVDLCYQFSCGSHHYGRGCAFSKATSRYVVFYHTSQDWQQKSSLKEIETSRYHSMCMPNYGDQFQSKSKWILST